MVYNFLVFFFGGGGAFRACVLASKLAKRPNTFKNIVKNAIWQILMQTSNPMNKLQKILSFTVSVHGLMWFLPLLLCAKVLALLFFWGKLFVTTFTMD